MKQSSNHAKRNALEIIKYVNSIKQLRHNITIEQNGLYIQLLYLNNMMNMNNREDTFSI